MATGATWTMGPWSCADIAGLEPFTGPTMAHTASAKSPGGDSVLNEVPDNMLTWHDRAMMADDPSFVRLRLGPQGRVVVPAHFRRALGLEVGDALVASIEGGRLVLAPREVARARLLERFPAVAGAPSAVDELLAARRVESEREAADVAGSDEPT
jgi:bifunctional DNA-binding transcriptional regulator/antitoxin component of YhaV-PrlF toxin-antitoxin module